LHPVALGIDLELLAGVRLPAGDAETNPDDADEVAAIGLPVALLAWPVIVARHDVSPWIWASVPVWFQTWLPFSILSSSGSSSFSPVRSGKKVLSVCKNDPFPRIFSWPSMTA